jgi:hypothetical protein
MFPRPLALPAAVRPVRRRRNHQSFGKLLFYPERLVTSLSRFTGSPMRVSCWVMCSAARLFGIGIH